MFKCYLCKKITSPGIPCHILPIEIREKEYQTKRGIVFGWEIKKTAKFCPDCAKIFNPPIPEKKPFKSFRQYSWFSDFTNKKPLRPKKEDRRIDKIDKR